MSPAERFATHLIVTPETCCHGKAVVYCPICDGGLSYCTRCKGGEMDLLNKTCAERLVGCLVVLTDGWKGRVVSTTPDGKGIRIENGVGRIRAVTAEWVATVRRPS